MKSFAKWRNEKLLTETSDWYFDMESDEEPAHSTAPSSLSGGITRKDCQPQVFNPSQCQREPAGFGTDVVSRTTEGTPESAGATPTLSYGIPARAPYLGSFEQYMQHRRKVAENADQLPAVDTPDSTEDQELTDAVQRLIGILQRKATRLGPQKLVHLGNVLNKTIGDLVQAKPSARTGYRMGLKQQLRNMQGGPQKAPQSPTPTVAA